MEQKECPSCKMMIPKGAKVCPYCRKKLSMSTLSKLILILIGLSFFAAYVTKPKEPLSNTAKAAVDSPNFHSAKYVKDMALSSLQLKYTFSKEGLGGDVMIANFTIKNNGSDDVKDLTINCVSYAKSGTKIDSNTRTIYDIVRAGKTRHFNRFNMGFINSQAQSSACRVTDLSLL